MKAIQQFRQKMQAGQVCMGAGVGFADPLVTEALADSCDFVFIDLEHSGLSTEAMLLHLLAARGRGIPALVRVAEPVEAFIKPVLDGGADGVVAPQVRSVEQVKRFVDACRYPPRGTRGFGPRVPSNYGRNGGKAWIAEAADLVFAAVQIETREAVEDIERLVRVPGLDAVFIGPYDLSAALGVIGELEHPAVQAAIDRIIASAREAGLFVGAGMRTDPAFALSMAKRGVQWMQVGSDFAFMVRGMDQITKAVRDGLKEP